MMRSLIPLSAALLLSLGEVSAFNLPCGRAIGLRGSNGLLGARRSLCPAAAHPRVLASPISRTRAQVVMQATEEEEAASDDAPAAPATRVRYLSAEMAKNIDTELIAGGQPLNVLMEHAGLAVADAIWSSYSPSKVGEKKVLLVAGKGNNGGDALVAARFLHYYGYKVEVVYPEPQETEPFLGLVKLLDDLGIVISAELPETPSEYYMVVDGIFGFSYQGPPRAPYDAMIAKLKDYNDGFGKCELVCIDVPSGWDVDVGPPAEATMSLYPGMLVSLTAPKKCSEKFFGRHLIGMRWVPDRVVEKFNLDIPKYTDRSTWTTAVAPGLPDISSKTAPTQVKMVDASAAVASPGMGMINGVDPAKMQGLPDRELQTAINAQIQQVLQLVVEKDEGWDQACRTKLVTGLIPLGFESTHSPDRTKIAKVTFLAAKVLRTEGFDCLDMLAEGREMADTAFDDGWDMEAGQVLRGIAKLYEAEGVSDTAIGIREDIDRIIEDRDYPKNLEPRAPRPSYTIKDKWNVVIRGPAGVGEEAIEIVARPVQSAKLLIKAWLGSSEMDVDTIGDYELRVPEEATSWRVGLVDSELEIGMTGIMPDGEVQVLLKAPKEEDKEEVTATAVAEDSE